MRFPSNAPCSVHACFGALVPLSLGRAGDRLTVSRAAGGKRARQRMDGSLEGWVDVMYWTNEALGTWTVIYFIPLILFGSLFAILCILMFRNTLSSSGGKLAFRVRFARSGGHRSLSEQTFGQMCIDNVT